MRPGIAETEGGVNARRTGHARVAPGLERRRLLGAPRDDPDISAEILGNRRDEKQLGIRLRSEETSDARWIAADTPCKISLG